MMVSCCSSRWVCAMLAGSMGWTREGTDDPLRGLAPVRSIKISTQVTGQKRTALPAPIEFFLRNFTHLKDLSKADHLLSETQHWLWEPCPWPSCLNQVLTLVQMTQCHSPSIWSQEDSRKPSGGCGPVWNCLTIAARTGTSLGFSQGTPLSCSF